MDPFTARGGSRVPGTNTQSIKMENIFNSSTLEFMFAPYEKVEMTKEIEEIIRLAIEIPVLRIRIPEPKMCCKCDTLEADAGGVVCSECDKYLYDKYCKDDDDDRPHCSLVDCNGDCGTLFCGCIDLCRCRYW